MIDQLSPQGKFRVDMVMDGANIASSNLAIPSSVPATIKAGVCDERGAMHDTPDTT